MKTIISRLIPWILVIFLAFIILSNKFSGFSFFSKAKDSTVVTNNMIVEKIESIGKLELTKFYIKDVVEHSEIQQWWPDPKVILIVSGEVVGCIDLTKIDSNDVKITAEKISVKLPEPEICYSKINHNESKVYKIEYGIFQEGKLIDKAYAMAEKNILAGAMKMKILDQTKKSAQNILKPVLENTSGKKVELYF